MGTLFRRGYVLRARCVECDLDLEGSNGAHYGGPIIMGYAVGGLAGMATFVLVFLRFGYASWVLWISVLAAVVAILLTFRHCKAFWTWWLYATGELRSGEPRPG